MSEVIKSLRWVSAGKVVTQIGSWLSTIVVMKILAPADYGLVAMSTLLSEYLMYLADMGLASSLTSSRVSDHEILGAAHGVSIVVGLVLAALTVILAPPAAHYFGHPEIVGLMRLSAIHFIALGVSSIPRTRLAMQMRFRDITIANVAAASISTLLTLTLALLGAGAWALVWGSVALGATRATILWRYATDIPPPVFALSPLSGLMVRSGYALANSSVWYWYTQLDVLIVGRNLGDKILGHLSVGKVLAFLPASRIMEIANQVALPAFSRIQDDKVEFERAYSKSIQIGALVGIPVLWGLAATSQEFILVLLGEKWRDTIPVVAIMAIVMPCRLLGAITSTLLQAAGHQRSVLVYNSQILVVSGVLMLLLFKLGIVGIAMAWAVSIPLGFALGVQATRTQLGMHSMVVLRQIAIAALPSAIMAACVLLVPEVAKSMGVEALILLLIAKVSVGVVVYAGCLRYMLPSQWKLLIGTFRQFIGR
jgi:teichuronic acid exporter